MCILTTGMSYPEYSGDNLQEWIKFYSFSRDFVQCFQELGISFLIELNDLYNDSESMMFIKNRVKSLEFIRFQKVREYTRALSLGD